MDQQETNDFSHDWSEFPGYFPGEIDFFKPRRPRMPRTMERKVTVKSNLKSGGHGSNCFGWSKFGYHVVTKSL